MIPKVLLLVDFSEEYGRGLLNGIAKYSRLFGPWSFCRFPLIHRGKGSINDIIAWAKDWGADGIIAQIEDENICTQLLQLGKPLIAQDVNERFSNIPNITGLYRETGRMGAEHLLNKGFKNFAYYGFQNIVWSRERYEGFSQRVSQAGYMVHIYQHLREATPPLWSYRESDLSDWLRGLPKPIGLMACDDNQGQHVTEACKAVGIEVPEEIAVLGVDNDVSICNLSDPPLSSISLNTEKAGFETAQMLHRMMGGSLGNLNDIRVAPLQVIPRRSTDFFAVNDKEISKALHFIYYHFKDGISVNDVVNATALSRRVLEKRFRLVLDRSILDEINSLRVRHVKQLLIETELPIAEISMACGWANTKNLSRFFRTSEGVSPIEFRKSKRKW